MRAKIVELLEQSRSIENGAAFFYKELKKLGVHRVIHNNTTTDVIAWKEGAAWEWLIAPTFTMGQMISGKGYLALNKLPSIQYSEIK